MTKREELAKEYAKRFMENPDNHDWDYWERKLAAAWKNGFDVRGQLDAQIALEGHFQISCTAIEATGIIRRTRDCIAEAIEKVGKE